MSEASAAAGEIQVATREDSPVVRTVSVEISEARVRVAFDNAYKRLGRGAQVKGFRRGKVPRKVLERVYGAAAAEEIERTLVSETLADALELAEVLPVVEPEIDATAPAQGEAFRYAARVEVRPEITLPKLEGLPARRPAVDVGEEEVEERIDSMRRGAAPLVEVPEDEVAVEGDTVHVDFEGRIDGELFDGGAAEDVPIELGSGRMIPGFEEQLTGVVSGQELDLNVQFPADYGNAELQGRDAVFAARVRAVKRVQLPELDDEFAKDVGEDSLEALRTQVREGLVSQAEQQAKSELHRTLLESLVERSEFEVPPGLIEGQLQAQMRSMQQQFEGRMPREALEQQLARMQENGREGAERQVRERLLLDAVAKDQELTVEPAAIDARLEEIAQAQGADLDTIRQLAESQGWTSSIEGELLHEAALDFLGAGASVEEVADD